MNNENAEVATRKSKRIHDQAPSEQFSNFMKTGWTPTDLTDLEPLEVVTYAYSRRQVLSAAFKGIRLVFPAGNFKVRANDTDYNYRPDSAYVYYSGVQGADSTADAVLVLEPSGDSHITYLYMNPRSTRDTDAFYRDAKYGELWVGRRFTLAEAKARYQIETRALSEIETLLGDGKETLTLRDIDLTIEKQIKTHSREEEFAIFVSEQRFCKDEYELREMQRAVDATALGFNDVIHAIPAAIETPRGERVLDGAFYGRARILGNDLGYNTIIGAGSHACVLHWIRNDGDVRRGELVLVDAG
ncbi:MAG: M24 family metallopeptidase, partial [Planctomycetes bacterium]|nr:M24 family metallopeptidase [Planctomycetota bacterium]